MHVLPESPKNSSAHRYWQQVLKRISFSRTAFEKAIDEEPAVRFTSADAG